MGTAKFGFDDESGNYDPVTLAPPKEIPCMKCDDKLVHESCKLLNPMIWCYICKCGAKAEIQETQTIEHWPEDVRKRYDEMIKNWVKNGMKYKEVPGPCYYNSRGITKIEIDE